MQCTKNINFKLLNNFYIEIFHYEKKSVTGTNFTIDHKLHE